jgi:hypothetical protein
MAVSETGGYAQVSKASAAEYVAACEAQYGVDRVHRVGLPVHRARGVECVAYTVDECQEQVPLDSLASVKRYRRKGAQAEAAMRPARISGGNASTASTAILAGMALIPIIAYQIM